MSTALTTFLLLMISEITCQTCQHLYFSAPSSHLHLEKCIFLEDTPSPLVQCHIYGVTYANGTYARNIRPEVFLSITFNFNGPEENGVQKSRCLSMQRIELRSINQLPTSAGEQIIVLYNGAKKEISGIDEFHLTISFPHNNSESDAYKKQYSSCNISVSPISQNCKTILRDESVILLNAARYNTMTSFKQFSAEFLNRRQGTLEYFRVLTDRSLLNTPNFLHQFRHSNIKTLNLNGNKMDSDFFQWCDISKLQHVTHLFLSQCNISEIKFSGKCGENYNMELLDLSENELEQINIGLQKLKNLKELNFSYQQKISSFEINVEAVTNIETLHLNFLPIQKLSQSHFSWVPKLQYLSIRSCKIVTIEENTFHELKFLKYLDLSDNRNLKYIFRDTFLQLTPFSTLIVAFNPQLITSLSGLNIKNISMFDLTNCSLTTFPTYSGSVETLNVSSNAIVELTKIDFIYNIRNLNLSYNKIQSVNSEMGENLSKLDVVDIGGNPFDCHNCAQNDFRHFLEANIGIVQNLGTFNNITCAYPVEEKGKLIVNTIYVCYSYWIIIGIPVSSFILLLAITLTALCFVYRFELTYLKQLWRMKRKNGNRPVQSDVQSEFDAFISYCAADRSWVIDKLLPNLEPPLGQYNLCLHERDFQLGKFIMDNIVENIEKSRHVIFVLSNNFLKSEWCIWELRMAAHRIFEKSSSRFLILLKMEDLNGDLVPLSLRILQTTRTYLEWNRNQQDMFWCRLRQVLGKPLSCTAQESREPENPFKDVDEELMNLEALRNNPEMLDKYISDLETSV